MSPPKPSISRNALLASCAYMLQACGLTVHDLARHVGASPVTLSLTRPRTAPDGGPLLSRNAEVVLEMADSAAGVLSSEVRARIGCAPSAAQGHCQALVERGLLFREKETGSNAYRYFRQKVHADAFSANRATWRVGSGAAAVAPQKGKAAAPVATAAPKPSPAPKPKAALVAAAKSAEPAAVPVAPKVELSEAERNAVRVKLAKQAGARKAAPPLGPRTARKAPGKPGAELVVPATGTVTLPAAPRPKPAAEPVMTPDTKRVIDTTRRANSRLEAAPPLPPDPRWPSFAATKVGVNPDTGKAWGA